MPDGKRTEEIAADLVTDATGRGSATPRWLSELGFAAPKAPADRAAHRGGVLALFMGLSANRRQQVVVCCSLSLEKRKA
jgi:hypothetical protein